MSATSAYDGNMTNMIKYPVFYFWKHLKSSKMVEESFLKQGNDNLPNQCPNKKLSSTKEMQSVKTQDDTKYTTLTNYAIAATIKQV